MSYGEMVNDLGRDFIYKQGCINAIEFIGKFLLFIVLAYLVFTLKCTL